MPRREYVIRVFVSSPSDLADERQCLEELVRELNISWSQHLGLRLELVRWETSVLPGVGSEPQAVIEAAIGDDYDVFVGLLWKRFGTPTAAYGSGTAQEFERALARAQNEASFRLMVYFNETPVSPSEIDPTQLAQVQAFRESLGARGVLWLSYKDRLEFQQLLRLHLAKLAQEWGGRLDAGEAESRPLPPPTTAPQPPAAATEHEPEEEGLLDLLEVIQEDIATLTSNAGRIGEAITDVGSQLQAGTQALDALRASGKTDNARIKRVINRVAEDLEVFATRIDAEAPVLAVVYERMVKAVSRAAVIQCDLPTADDPINAAITAANTLIESIRTAKAGAEGMRAAAANLPRMSTAMNRARRRATEALDRLASEFQRAMDVTEGVLVNLQGRLQ